MSTKFFRLYTDTNESAQQAIDKTKQALEKVNGVIITEARTGQNGKGTYTLVRLAKGWSPSWETVTALLSQEFIGVNFILGNQNEARYSNSETVRLY